MNERIRELATKCYKTGPLGKDGWPEYTSFDEQKFAELIIAQCAMIGNYAHDGGEYPGPMIKEYFGVK